MGQRVGCPSLLCASTLLLLACPIAAEEELTVSEAYQHLMDSWSFPRYIHENDKGAVAVLRAHPEQAAALLLEKLSYDKGPVSRKAPLVTRLLSTEDRLKLARSRKAPFVATLLPMEDRLKLARAVSRTYPSGAPTPFSQFLASVGKEEDMPKLEAEIKADPNGHGAGLAATIAHHKNKAGLAMLLELSRETEGALWYLPGVAEALEAEQGKAPTGPGDQPDTSEEPRRLAFRPAMAEGNRAEENRRTLRTAEDSYRLALSEAADYRERSEANRAISRVKQLKHVDALLSDGQRALGRGDYREAASKFTDASRKMRYISRAPRWVTTEAGGVRAKIDGARKALPNQIDAEAKKKMDRRRRAGFRTLALHVAVCAKGPALALAFIATNIGPQDLAVPPILSGGSCLEVLKPDGSRQKLFPLGKGEGPSVVIEPMGTRTWYVELARLESLTKFDLPGAYLLRWIVTQGGDAAPVSSPNLLLVKKSDDMEGDRHQGYVARDVRWSSSDTEGGGSVALKIGVWIEKTPALAFVARNRGDADFATAPLGVAVSRVFVVAPGGKRENLTTASRYTPVVVHPAEAKIWRVNPLSFVGEPATGVYGFHWQLVSWDREQRKTMTVAESNELLVLVEEETKPAGEPPRKSPGEAAPVTEAAPTR